MARAPAGWGARELRYIPGGSYSHEPGDEGYQRGEIERAGPVCREAMPHIRQRESERADAARGPKALGTRERPETASPQTSHSRR